MQDTLSGLSFYSLIKPLRMCKGDLGTGSSTIIGALDGGPDVACQI